MPLLSEPATKEARRREGSWDVYVLWVLAAGLGAYAIYAGSILLLATAVTVSYLMLTTMLMWTAWMAVVLLALLIALSSLFIMVPAAFLPGQPHTQEVCVCLMSAADQLSEPALSRPVVLAPSLIDVHRALVLCASEQPALRDTVAVGLILAFLLHWTCWPHAHPAMVVVDIILAIVFAGLAFLTMTVRGFIGKTVRSSRASSQVDCGSGFVALGTPRPPADRHGATQWSNVVVADGRGVRLDAAFYQHPRQLQHAAPDRRWILYMGGNGEVYEFNLAIMEELAQTLGVNVFLYNYRGVAFSDGEATSGEDLVNDAMLILTYLEEQLAANPRHVLLLGRSIGGGIGTLARACHSPQGPIVSDRSFASLPDAAFSRLDAAGAWPALQGKKMLIYHDDDEIIHYDRASLHKRLLGANALGDTVVVRLTRADEEVVDFHNTPLKVFAEYPDIIKEWRAMLSLDGAPVAESSSVTVTGASA
ncbi:uncharacterized protein MONBRDRAFT_38377 [Monosiga brevicollis MX1]|uniref:Serine aminopeptidase S33 domain-containing protein n=1 Tax=Monosiga brevicollis TaxID=81824 RepID=A9V7B7_MONBE|nr:uncharacterized protein MONBRDRAFT_38377 [Monosiga brevicollis MX1]EDQ86555.1 predicted protein [Monosiga brevicollis MX1]|eukprot:XP_001748668.1 hypothetical protein [Monosiga brevicollis MX1]